MSFNSEQLAYAGNAAINYFLRNDPIDNVNIARPLIKKLMEEKKPYVGGLQYVVEQLRYSNDSNFQSYFGDTQVTYNRKRTLQQAKYTWGSFHDGFGLNEDELAQNGIVMTDDKSSVPSEAEKVQLTNQDVVRGHAAVPSAIAPRDFHLLRQVASGGSRDARDRCILPPSVDRLVEAAHNLRGRRGGRNQEVQAGDVGR